jgi:ABC-type transport system involved in cytochrome c biogenesis permease subunit
MVTDALLVAALLSLAGGTVVELALAGGAHLGMRPATEPAQPGTVSTGRVGPSAAIVGLLGGLVFVVAALVARALAAGHAPWSNMYEFNQAFAAASLAAYLFLARRLPVHGLAPLVALVAAALIAYTLTLPSEIVPLPPALQTPFFLTVHVGSAMLAYGLYAVAGVAALGQIAQARARGRVGWLPPAGVCQAAAHRAVLLGLPVLSLAIVLGAAWANLAWRSYWSNDPKELAAAGTWFIYAAYLHLVGRRDRWGAAAPWLLVLGAGAVAFTYFAANLVIPGQHSYSGL